jgi:hypothetical protein
MKALIAVVWLLFVLGAAQTLDASKLGDAVGDEVASSMLAGAVAPASSRIATVEEHEPRRRARGAPRERRHRTSPHQEEPVDLQAGDVSFVCIVC